MEAEKLMFDVGLMCDRHIKGNCTLITLIASERSITTIGWKANEGSIKELSSVMACTERRLEAFLTAST